MIYDNFWIDPEYETPDSRRHDLSLDEIAATMDGDAAQLAAHGSCDFLSRADLSRTKGEEERAVRACVGPKRDPDASSRLTGPHPCRSSGCGLVPRLWPGSGRDQASRAGPPTHWIPMRKL